MSEDLKEKVLGLTDEAPVKAKVTTSPKASAKRTVAKGGVAPTGAKDAPPAGSKDGTLGAKD
ncbi:MAG TPA: hypothetical protein VFU22_08890 [Roseiflexaceae bacterium]|nr:hypothetical protein [Roseiflexaceae bacterium]